MHELIDKATCLFSLVYWCSSFLSLDCTYSLEIYSYATTEYANMIQLSNYGCVCVCERERERKNIRFGLSMFDASSDISSYACQSSDEEFFFFFFLDQYYKPECELRLTWSLVLVLLDNKYRDNDFCQMLIPIQLIVLGWMLFDVDVVLELHIDYLNWKANDEMNDLN